MTKILEDFQKFITRGNVIDMAVGVIIGGAFGKIVTSLVNDILMPPIGMLLGKVDFANLYVSLSGQKFESLAAAQKAGAPTLNYGVFLNNVINFMIVAFVIFLLIKQINRLFQQKPPAPAAAPATMECPYCCSSISLKATRCPHCTSGLPEK